MSKQQVPRSFYALTLVILLLTCMILFRAVSSFPIVIDEYILLITALAAISEYLAPVVGGYSASLSFPLVMTAILLGGPLAGAVVAGVSAIKPDALTSPKGFVTSAYNVAQHTSVAVIGGWLYLSCGGGSVPFRSVDFPALLVPLIVCSAASVATNMFLTGLGVSVLYRTNPSEVLKSVAGYAPSLTALSAVGYLIAQVVAVNPLGLPLFVFPLWVARQLYENFVSLDRAYTDTIRSLVNVLDAKDPYTMGHSARVAAYAVRLGNRLRLPQHDLEMLEHAGLLHDLGKVRIRGSLLRKAGPLSQEERVLVSRHPAEGAALIASVEHLGSLATAIREHHERPDGLGYPSGLRQQDLCLLGRILAIADAFDAMTSDRPYRAGLDRMAALDELQAHAGTQFDPALVKAFVGEMNEEDFTPIEQSQQVSVELAPGVAS